jgi:hypothetical protein
VPTINRVNASPLGVMIAATKIKIAKACFLYFFNMLLDMIPILDKIAAKAGISKTTPIMRISHVNMEM